MKSDGYDHLKKHNVDVLSQIKPLAPLLPQNTVSSTPTPFVMNSVTSSPPLGYIGNGSEQQQWTAAATDHSSSYVSGSTLITGPPVSSATNSRSLHEVERALVTLLDFFSHGGFMAEAMIVFRLKEKIMPSAQQ
jgi:hypothetical protein